MQSPITQLINTRAKAITPTTQFDTLKGQNLKIRESYSRNL